MQEFWQKRGIAVASAVKKSNNLPELLSPAGSLAALKAAVNAGADAVYFGGTEFSARANAKNFSREEIKYAIALCRERGVKTNITANTLVFDRELDEWLRYGEFLYQAGADAMIVADLGAAHELHRRLPDLALHASTQAGICDVGGARLASEIGFSRVVLSRELDRTDIKKITDECGIETEMFIHGALCVSVSGQCLFSSAVGGRSGNRGECAQPCRMEYGGEYPLSLKDYCLAPYIPEILDIGVSSLKIEGRMKSPEYVYGVTEIYRRLIDERRAPDKSEMKRLEAYFSRSGFTDAYFTGGDRGKMTGVRTDADKAKSASADIRIAQSDAAVKTVFPLRELPSTAGGEVVFERTAKSADKRKELVLEFISPERLEKSGIRADGRQRVILPCDRFDSRFADGASIPPVFFEREADDVRKQIKKAVGDGAKYISVGSLGGIAAAKEAGVPFVCNMRCSTANTLTAMLYKKLGAELSVISPELNVAAARDINRGVKSAVFSYGKLPLMTLTRCIIKPRTGCEKCGYDKCSPRIVLKDRMGVSFPVFAEYGHRNVIYNTIPSFVGGKETEGTGLSLCWLSFTDEGGGECAETVKSFVLGREPSFPVRRAGIRKTAKKEISENGKDIRNRYGNLQHPHLRQGKRNKGKGTLGGRGR